jgi:hypothetical protein
LKIYWRIAFDFGSMTWFAIYIAPQQCTLNCRPTTVQVNDIFRHHPMHPQLSRHEVDKRTLTSKVASYDMLTSENDICWLCEDNQLAFKDGTWMNASCMRTPDSLHVIRNAFARQHFPSLAIIFVFSFWHLKHTSTCAYLRPNLHLLYL